MAVCSRPTCTEIVWNESQSVDYVPFSLQDYIDIAEQYYYLGLGDWIFAVLPVPPFNQQDDTEYLDYFRSKGGTEDIVRKASRLRVLVPSFLESCVNEILAATPEVVGFTTTFTQNVPSLVLAKLLKTRKPSVKIVLGGSNCDGPMGAALQKAFPWVDVVVRGEGERVVPQLIRDLLAGREVQT